MASSPSRMLSLCSLLLLVVCALCRVQGHEPLSASLRLRALLDGDEAGLKDKTFAFLTKYEENFPLGSVATTPKAYAVWGWSEGDKSIKYAIVASSAPSEALSATTGDGILYIHLHVKGLRGQNSTDKLLLAKASGAFPIEDGYKVYSKGSINDTVVANWTNTLGMKTAKSLWDEVAAGNSYINIHTTANPDGEARGQNDWNYDDIEILEDMIPATIRSNDSNWRMGFLTSYELTTPLRAGNKTARAFAVYGWNGTSNSVQYAVLSGPRATDGLFQVTKYADVTATLHIGAGRGKTATMSLPLKVPTDSTWQAEGGLKIMAQGSISDSTANSNTTTATMKASDVWAAIAAGNTYTVVSTPANPSGEVRGQNDWEYQGLELAKELTAPTEAKAAGSKKSWAPALQPHCLSLVMGAAVVMMSLLA